jgi:hypothetical protein
MAKKPRSTSRPGRGRSSKPARARETKGAQEALQGPPARETTIQKSDRERAVVEEGERHNATSPALTGGDVDADWQRAAQTGEEAVGGSVATPDQDTVDELGEALGVPQAPDAEFRPTAEILEARDRYRWEQER